MTCSCIDDVGSDSVERAVAVSRSVELFPPNPLKRGCGVTVHGLDSDFFECKQLVTLRQRFDP